MKMHCPICLNPLEEIGHKGLFWSLKNGIIYYCEACNAEITISVEYYGSFLPEDDEDDKDDEIGGDDDDEENMP